MVVPLKPHFYEGFLSNSIAYTPRPETSLITTTMTTITKIRWIKAPPKWNENPRSQSINKITAIVQSIFRLYILSHDLIKPNWCVPL
jgi:hypothetical protein